MSEREITISLKAKNLTREEFAKARTELLGISDSAAKASKAGEGLRGTFMNVAAGLGVFAAASAAFSAVKSGLTSVVGGAIDMNSTLEKSTLQFGTLMGDAGKAEAHVRSLFEFAKKTPFETGPIIQASRMMRTFGGDALDTKENLTLIGDASAATGAPIEDLGFWVGRLYANLKAGQPFGEAAARLQELAVLSPAARTQMEALQKSGASADEVFAAFQGRLGEFSGAMVAQAGTWEGLTSSISDAVSIMMADALKPMFDTIKVGAEMVLEVLGSDGMQAVFEGVRASLVGSLGSNSREVILSIADTVLGFGSTLLQVAGWAESIFGGALNGVRAVAYTLAAGIAGLGATTVSVFKGIAQGASYLPGVGDSLNGAIGNLQRWQDELESTRYGMVELSKESATAATTKSVLGRSIDGARTVLDAMQTALHASKAGLEANTQAEVVARGPKQELTTLTKAQAAALESQEKATKKLWQEVEKLNDKNLNLRQQIEAGIFGTFTTELTNTSALTSRSNAEAGKLRQQLEAWAQTNGATLAPSIRAVSSALVESSTATTGFSASVSSAMQKLPGVMLGAIQGGGQVGKAAGAHLGGTLGEWAGKAAGPALGKMLGSTLGGGVASMFGPVGTMIGGFLGDKIGSVAGKIMGGLFKSDGKAANNIRDEFVNAAGGIHQLNVKAQEAGLSLDRLLKAKNPDQVKAAIAEIEGAIGSHSAALASAEEVASKYGITLSQMGEKFKQGKLDEAARTFVDDIKVLKAAGLDMTTITAEMGDEFAAYVQQVIAAGGTVPRELQPIAAEMIKQGKLSVTNKEAHERLTAKRIDLERQLADAMKDTSADGQRKADELKKAIELTNKEVEGTTTSFDEMDDVPWAENLNDMFKDVMVVLKDLVASLKGDVTSGFGAAERSGVEFGRGVTKAIDGIPRRIEIEVEGNYNPPDIDNASPGYSIGTKRAHGSYFVDFGRESKVRLHGPEAVLTPDDAPGFVASYLAANGGGGSGSSGGSAPINVYTLVEIDAAGRSSQRVISDREYLRREMQQVFRAGGIQVPREAVAGPI